MSEEARREERRQGQDLRLKLQDGSSELIVTICRFYESCINEAVMLLLNHHITCCYYEAYSQRYKCQFGNHFKEGHAMKGHVGVFL